MGKRGRRVKLPVTARVVVQRRINRKLDEIGKNAGTVRVPVTTRALIQRINRKLAAQDEQLRATRGEGQARMELGDYYVINQNRNAVVSKHVDPEQCGRDLGVLRPWEQIVEDHA
jgi:hypothetical protein